MTEKTATNTNGTPLLINIPPFLRKYPYWSVCGTPKKQLDDEKPTTKAPLSADGYASWDNLFPTPEAALEAMSKYEHAHHIGFILPPEGIIEDGKLLICNDVDFKNPDVVVHPDVAREDNSEKLRDFVNSCSSYAEFSVSGKGYHVWFYAAIPLPEKNVDDTYGVGLFFRKHNIIVTGKIIPGSQRDIHLIPDNVLMNMVKWSKGPDAISPTGSIDVGSGKKFDLPDKILNGSKHTCLRGLTLSMANQKMTIDELMFVCHSMNNSGRIMPPISQDDMEKKVRPLCVTAVKKVAKERLEHEKNPEYEGLYYYKLVTKGDDVEEKLTLDYTAIVAWLHKKFHTISFKDEIYIYNGEVYVPDTGKASVCGNEMRVFLETIGYPGAKTAIAREIINQLVMYEPVLEYPFNSQEGLLPVKNGVLHFDFENDKVELKPHSHEHLFTIQLPVVYDPEKTGETFKTDVLSKYVDEEMLPVLYMAPAMAILQLIKHRVFKKSIICEGEGNSGKTTYLEWLLEMFSLKYCSSISLTEIAEDRFAFAQLEGKIINSYDELSDMPLKEIERFKKLTGRQDHKIEKKGIDGYDTILTALHIFATNRPPTVSDVIAFDNAFWNRWIYVHFDNVFPVDMKFKEKHFTQDNISGSFNDVIKMVLQVERDGLPYIPDPSAVKEEWTSHADPLKKFISENMIDTTEQNNFSKEQFFRAYISYCKEQGISPRKMPATVTMLTQMLFKCHVTTTQLPAKKGTAERPYVYRMARAWKKDSAYKPPVGFDIYSPCQTGLSNS